MLMHVRLIFDRGQHLGPGEVERGLPNVHDRGRKLQELHTNLKNTEKVTNVLVYDMRLYSSVQIFQVMSRKVAFKIKHIHIDLLFIESLL